MRCVAGCIAIALRFACLLFCSYPFAVSADMVSNWQATLDTSAAAGKYKVVFEWDHIHTEAVTVDFQANGQKVYNAADDPRCAGSSSTKSSIDNQPFWMPRFFPRAVPSEITEATGIRFVSVDWQPCGHHDIIICHAESHYDMHFYYFDEAELSDLPMCDIGSASNPGLPVCRDSGSVKPNHDYFELIDDDIPISMKVSEKGGDATVSQVDRSVNFCVDPTSAILKSGVHYGDKSETLSEWKTPVTIIGSHDCKLMFFEPMFSWKWVSGNANFNNPTNSWPKYEVTDIVYKNKQYEPLPTSWKLEVSSGCKADHVYTDTTQGSCHIKVTVEGSRCTGGACPAPQRKCGEMPTCVGDSGALYASPSGPLTAASDTTVTTVTTVTVAAVTTVTTVGAPTNPTMTQVTGAVTMTVENPTALLTDNDFVAGVAAGIASMSGNGITASQVTVVLSIGARRLGWEGRRLSGTLNVAYTIVIPESLAESIQTSIAGTSTSQLTEKIVKALTDAGLTGSNYALTVETKPDPVVTVVDAGNSDAFGQTRSITAIRASLLAAVAALGRQSCNA